MTRLPTNRLRTFPGRREQNLFARLECKSHLHQGRQSAVNGLVIHQGGREMPGKKIK
ncbi:hypothetical protein BH20ACI3_BH20ACI3_20650 [soil metagenome]